MMSNELNRHVGNYRLIRLLGTGGQASVYLGEHLYLGTLAAIKVLHEPLQDENVEKFYTEARLIASLIHPHILRVLDFSIDAATGMPFLVMDYAPNGSLRQRHCKGEVLPLNLIVGYVEQVAAALQYAHKQCYPNNRRLIHRDIKPESLLLGPNDKVLLSDFGIAVLAHTTNPSKKLERAGTPHYMAPEQIQGKPHRASDQYALGVVVYEWLTGTCPFNGSHKEIAEKHVDVSPPPLRERIPSLSLEVERVVLKALAKQHKERFASVEKFATALKLAAADSPGLYTYNKHTAPVKAVAWSPDGRRIASAGQDGTVQVWDAATGRKGYTYTGHSSSVTAVVWSPDGQRIASAGQKDTVQVWNTIRGNTYRGHSSDVLALSWGVWSPQKAYIASGFLDGTVGVWDVATGSMVHIYRDDHAAPVNAVAWSPDGRRIASAGDDKKVRVREVAWGESGTSASRSTLTYRGHVNVITAVAWSPTGQHIASASYDRTVQVWSASSGNHIFTHNGHAAAVFAVAWSPDGTRIASASADHTVQVWQVRV